MLFGAAGVWAIFSGFDGRQPLFGTLLLVFGFGSLAFAWFKYHREVSLGLRVRSVLGVAKEPKSSGEVSGMVRNLRIFETKEKSYFSVKFTAIELKFGVSSLNLPSYAEG